MKPRPRMIATALAVLVAGAAGAGIALGIASALGDLKSTTVVTSSSETPSSLQQAASVGGKALTIPEIYERTAPGVVQVTSTQIVKAQQVNPFFQTPAQKVQALGSGFVIDKQGDIVTNYHVIQGATSIEVLFSNNVTTKATVIGTDISTDLAVLRVKVSPSALTPLAFGDSSALEVGDSVVAIGNPFGLDRTVTSGIVSAIYNPGEGSTATQNNYPVISQNNVQIPAIQTDAAINHGNSGGPLMNTLGQVIGVNSQIETGGTSQGNVGIGFAIQSNTVKEIVAQLLKNGKATHAQIGISVVGVTPQLASLYRLPVKQGVLVESVKAGSGAAKAGLKAGKQKVSVAGQTFFIGGDIIVKVDGVSLGSSVGKLESIVAGHKPGDKLSLEIYRGNTKMTVSVTLSNR
ncbi:MAG: trypsin-like peptidase domain-containing protein [Gaiellaceae bacterium]